MQNNPSQHTPCPLCNNPLKNVKTPQAGLLRFICLFCGSFNMTEEMFEDFDSSVGESTDKLIISAFAREKAITNPASK